MRQVSAENVKSFLRGSAAIGHGDLEAALAVIHPEVALESQRSATEGVYRGHEGIREFMADTAQTFDLFRPEYTDVRDLGERVLAIGSIRVRGKGSGVETDVPTAAVAEFREGLLWRFKDYVEPRLALEAAELRE